MFFTIYNTQLQNEQDLELSVSLIDFILKQSGQSLPDLILRQSLLTMFQVNSMAEPPGHIIQDSQPNKVVIFTSCCYFARVVLFGNNCSPLKSFPLELL